MKKWWKWLLLIIVILCSGFYLWNALTRPLFVHSAKINLIENPVANSTFNWPEQGRAAVGFINKNTKETNCRTFGDTEKFPTASIAKIITSLVILEKYPLTENYDGPIITMTESDIARLNATIQQSGSFVAIHAGEQLTERQILQGILMASANNLADGLAVWAFGSLENYRAAAEIWLKENNLSNIKIGSDASGLDPETQASSADLCKLILIASQNSAFTQIVSTKSVTFPLIGELKNTNSLIEQENIIGGKTGFTPEAGYGFVTLVNIDVNNSNQLAAVAVLGQSSYDEAFSQTQKLIDSLENNLTVHNLAKKGQIIGQVNSDWNKKIDLIAQDNIDVISWIDEPAKYEIFSYTENRRSLQANKSIGKVYFSGKSVNIMTKTELSHPNFLWRILHGFQ